MSLAKRNDGCYECRTRRVRCDKTEPECLKCQKKGIKCSGQGIECRFSKHMKRKHGAAASFSINSSANASSSKQTTTPTTSSSSKTSKQFLWVSVANDTTETPASEDSSSDSSSPSSSMSMELVPRRPQEGSGGPFSVVGPDDQFRDSTILPSPVGAIELVPAHSRMLFDHFSNFIASKMVVLDFNDNGYRQIILPLACEDELVGQAVSVISAFHLSSQVPSMHMAAERGQAAILSRLRDQSLNLSPDSLFSISTWVTILVLLVGDTITGSNNYVYLLQLLSRLAQLSATSSLPPATKAFIMEQTKMFQLFGFPLSSETKGVETMTRSPEYYLDFMTSYPLLTADPAQYSNVMIMKEVIRQACEIYRARASHEATRESSIEAVEQLRQTVLGLDLDLEGSHALVWAFFVASAESILPEHRDFFYTRLKGLFKCTRFGSIPLALETLNYIWSKQSSTDWTEVVTHERQILIM